MAKQSAIEQDGSIWSIIKCDVPCRVREWTYCNCSYFWKMRMHYIKLLPGDKVKLEMSPYDLSKAKLLIDIKGYSQWKLEHQ
jgi:translation initiation factor IF-1